MHEYFEITGNMGTIFCRQVTARNQFNTAEQIENLLDDNRYEVGKRLELKGIPVFFKYFSEIFGEFLLVYTGKDGFKLFKVTTDTYN